MQPTLDYLESRQLLSGTPSAIRSLYGLEAIAHKYGYAGEGQGVTVSVVVVGANPQIAAEEAGFDRKAHLAPTDIAIYDLGTGGVVTPSWSAEAYGDIALIHEMAPEAHIDLVEAADTGYNELMTADQYAAGLPGVVVVEDGWGGPEFAGEDFYDRYLGQAGVVVVAAVGDLDVLDYPAASPDAIAVGGYLAVGRYKAALAEMNGGRSSVYSDRTTPDVIMTAGTSVENGTSASSALFAGLAADAQAIRLKNGETLLDSVQVRDLMDGAPSGVFTPVEGEASRGSPNGPALVRLLAL